MLSLIVSPDVCDAVVGDLCEEFSLRALASPTDAARWYWRQALRSLPQLCATRARDTRWLSTVAVATAAYPVVGVFNAVGMFLSARWLGAWAANQALTAAVGLVAIGAGAHVASRIRPSAGHVLGGLVMCAALSFLLFRVDRSPVWYQVTFLLLGPLSAHLGTKTAAWVGAPGRTR